MSFMDKVKGLLGQHGDKVAKGLDKAGQMADSKTRGKYSGQIRSGTQKAKAAAERMGSEHGKGHGGGHDGRNGQGGHGDGPRGGHGQGGA